MYKGYFLIAIIFSLCIINCKGGNIKNNNTTLTTKDLRSILEDADTEEDYETYEEEDEYEADVEGQSPIEYFLFIQQWGGNFKRYKSFHP
jgi:hypothetical protein